MLIKLNGNPLSTQTIYGISSRGKRVVRYMTKKGKEMKSQYQWEIKSQWNKELIEGDVIMKIKLFFGDKRRRDIDNYNKLILDAMEGIVYKDDKQIKDLHITKEYDKENPRVEIWVSALNK